MPFRCGGAASERHDIAKDTLASYVDPTKRDCLLLAASCSFESSVLAALQELELAIMAGTIHGLVLTSPCIA